MTRPRMLAAAVGVVLSLAWSGVPASAGAQNGRGLPDRLTDAEFWALSAALSEPAGQFHSDNLVSNEMEFQKILPGLTDRHASGGVYLGVGPEQNFTYIAALKPRIAFILDIRAENRGLHLLYKALFELSRNRAEFVSLLFSRRMLPAADTASTAAEIFAAIDPAPPTDAQFSTNLARVFDVIRERHHLALSTRDSDGLRRAYQEFARAGTSASYSSNRAPTATAYNTYNDLMRATDANGQPASYLATEARFQFVKDLQARNLIVPVVGDFSGPIALRAIGDWLRAHQARVAVFYLSNVEDYLTGETSIAFCRNVATLPIDDDSELIRSSRFGTMLHGSLPPPVRTPIIPSMRSRKTLATFKDVVPKTGSADTVAFKPVQLTSQATGLYVRTSRIAEELVACRQP